MKINVYMESADNVINLSPSEALKLELKLNTSIYGKSWCSLGDILYNCRLNPHTHQVEKTIYNISQEQANWIKSNIDVDNYTKFYKLFY